MYFFFPKVTLLIFLGIITLCIAALTVYIIALLKQAKQNLATLDETVKIANAAFKPVLDNAAKISNSAAKFADSVYEKFENGTKIFGALGIVNKVLKIVNAEILNRGNKRKVGLFGLFGIIRKVRDLFRPKGK
jgi:uncharacterized protein YoxC